MDLSGENDAEDGVFKTMGGHGYEVLDLSSVFSPVQWGFISLFYTFKRTSTGRSSFPLPFSFLCGRLLNFA